MKSINRSHCNQKLFIICLITMSPIVLTLIIMLSGREKKWAKKKQKSGAKTKVCKKLLLLKFFFSRKKCLKTNAMKTLGRTNASKLIKNFAISSLLLILLLLLLCSCITSLSHSTCICYIDWTITFSILLVMYFG